MSTDLPATINADNTGLLKPRNIEDAWRMAQYYASSGLLPERYKSPAMVLTAMQYALELGLKPLTAMRQIAVVKGTPTVFGDLPLSMVYASGKMDYIKESLLDKTGKEISLANKNLTEPAFAALCIVKRKGESEPLEAFFTLDDAQQAGLSNSPTWKSYPKRMLRYRARSQALKDKFPDCLNGISIAEYDQNTTEEQEMINVSQVFTQNSASPSEVRRETGTVSVDHNGEGQSQERAPTLKERLAREKQAAAVHSPEVIIDAETVN
jgi:hypothetical protein